jgi:membrane protease subunit HflC
MNLALALSLVVLFIISGSFYIINETERGVKLRFGKVVVSDIKPGIHWKMPVIDQVKRFDGRVQVLDAKPGEFLTAEKKRMIVDSFIMWKIKDVERFYIRTQGQTQIAQMLMSPRVNGGLKDKIASRTLVEVVTDEREQIMDELQKEIDGIFHDELGIEVVDIRVKGVEFSAEVSETVYDQMRTERNRDAAEHRSEGRERAEGIKADADKQESIILAEAYRDAEKIRGEGDAKAANIYAKAFGRDPSFYEFTRSLTAYKNSFSNKADVLVIEPDSDFFRHMNKAR